MKTIEGRNSYSFVIRADCLRAGDVLLTRGANKDSSKIAAGTLGWYSHAAIWLPRAGSSPPYVQIWDLQLFESEDFGVGETPLREAYITTRDGQRFIGRLINDAVSITILRYPGLSDIDAARLGIAANRLRESDEHLGYSELDRLAMAVNLHPILRRRLEAFLQSHDQRDITLVPGPFCSELIAKYFLELSLPLFPEPRRPEQVSPNQLANSVLKEVRNCIFAPSSVVELELVRQLGLPRNEALPRWVRFRSRNIRLKQQVDKMEAYFRQSQEETINQQSRLLTSNAQEAIKRVKEAELHGESEMAQHIAVTAATQVLALVLIQEIQRRRATNAVDENSSWNTAEVRLIHLITTVSQSSGTALTRQTALLQLSVARKLAQDQHLRKTDINLTRVRKVAVQRWLRLREVETMMKPLMEKAEETFFFDPRTTEIIDEVLEAAFESMLARQP